MSDLPPGLEDFGKRLLAAAQATDPEPSRRRRWDPRRLLLPVAVAGLAGAAGAGAVKVLDGDGDPIRPDPGAAELSAPKDPAVVAASAVPDPGGGPPWVVRLYTNAAGQECVQSGRLRDGDFGQVQDGQFRRLPPDAPGICGRLASQGLIAAANLRPDPPRTVVFGLSSARRPIEVRRGQDVATARPVGLGAWIVVFKGTRPEERTTARVRGESAAVVVTRAQR